MSIVYMLALIASLIPGPERLYATDTSHSPDEIDAHFLRERQKKAARAMLKTFKVCTCHMENP